MVIRGRLPSLIVRMICLRRHPMVTSRHLGPAVDDSGSLVKEPRRRRNPGARPSLVGGGTWCIIHSQAGPTHPSALSNERSPSVTCTSQTIRTRRRNSGCVTEGAGGSSRSMGLDVTDVRGIIACSFAHRPHVRRTEVWGFRVTNGHFSRCLVHRGNHIEFQRMQVASPRVFFL